MSNLLSLIKQISTEANDASTPVAVLLSTLEKKNPIEVRISDTLTLPEEFLTVTRTVDELIKTNELKVGEGVLVLRTSGGGQYVLIDKII